MTIMLIIILVMMRVVMVVVVMIKIWENINVIDDIDCLCDGHVKKNKTKQV